MSGTALLAFGLGILLILLLAIFRGRTLPVLIYAIPPMNVLSDFLVRYPIMGGLHAGHVRSLFLLVLTMAMLPLLRWDRLTLPVFAFVIYMLALVPFASNIGMSLQGVMRVAVAILMFPVGYSFVRRPGQLRMVQAGVMAAVVLLLGNLVVAQVFQIGSVGYVEDGIYWGFTGISMAYVFAFALLMAPALFLMLPREQTGRRLLYVAVLFASFWGMLLVFRRGAIFGFLVGIVCYALFAPRRELVRIGKYFAVTMVCVLATYSPYANTMRQHYEQRGDVVGYVADTDRGRMAEFGLVISDITSGSVRHAMFGSEPFNSRLYFDTNRPLHVDYMGLLSGTGIVGLGLYLFIVFTIGYAVVKRASYLRETAGSVFCACAVAMLMASVVMSFSSFIYMITPVSLLFLYVGGVLGTFGSDDRRGHVQRHRPVGIKASRRAVGPVPARTFRTIHNDTV